MKIIILTAVVIAVALAITAVVIGISKSKMKMNVLDGPGMERQPEDYLTACTYYEGGGMEGGYESLELRLQHDGTVLFRYSSCPHNGAQEESYEKSFPSNAVFSTIRDICKKTGVLTWGTLPESDLQLLDAPVTSVSFSYFEDQQYTVHQNQLLPESGEGLFNEIYNALISLKE